MTLHDLSQLYYLTREIEMDRRRLEELEQQALPGAQRLSGMPGGGGTSDQVAELVAQIADLRELIRAKQKQCILERRWLEGYIAGIGDSLTRQVFTHRFIHGLSWRQVADCVGGGNTEAGCKKLVYRFLRKT